MSQTERHRRLRLLLKTLNRQRKRQASQIDILCNDLIGAQHAFIQRLYGISFAAEFYKALLGSTDLNNLLVRAGRLIRRDFPGVHVSFFLRQPEGCERHILESDEPLFPERDRPEDYFSPELADSICKANRSCTVDDMFGMGLDGNLKELNRFSMATLPLTDLGRSLGFVLIYRPSPQVLMPEELRRLSLILCGLARAIRVARVPLHSND